MDASTVAAVAQAVVAVASLGVTLVLTLLVYNGSRRLSALEADRAHRDAWNNLNTLALASDANLVAADSLLPSESSPGATVDDLRRKWLGWVLVNTIAAGYMAAVRGWTANPTYMYKLAERQVADLVQQDDLFELTQMGYEQEFAAFCRRVRAAGSPPSAGP